MADPPAPSTAPADTRPTVLLVCGVNGHGGPIQSLAAVTERADGFHTVVATQLARPGRKTSAIERAADDGIELPRPRRWGYLAAHATLLRRLRWIRRHVDVIHANGLTEAAVVAPVALLTGTPVVVWVHNFARPRAFALTEPLLRLRRTRWHWLAVSDLAASQLRHHTATLVPNPIAEGVVADRHEHNERPTVVYLAGTDRPYKGFDLLPAIIRAAGRSDITWRIYTSPPFSAPDPECRAAWTELQQMAADAPGKFGTVDIRGRTRDVAEAYAGADIVLAPSRLESFNRVVAEAFANGVPVVASDIGPHRALIEGSGGGAVFPLADPAAATAAVTALVDDPARRAEQGRAARAYAVRFDADRITEQITGAWNAARRSAG